jgi:hypothetical protein
MYTTIEAELENGRVKSAELQKLPSVAHVLITLLQQPVEKKPDWSVIQPLLGKLKLRCDTVKWQKAIRAEWN